MANNPVPRVWVLHDGKPGMASQALGLADATGFPYQEKRLAVRSPWSALPPQLWLGPLHAVRHNGEALAPPWPDLVIGCGRNTAAVALAIKRAADGDTVAAQVQDPRIGRRIFDLLVVPEHDRLRGPRVLVTRGAVHRVTPQRLTAELLKFPELQALPRPVTAILLGGANRAYRFDLQHLERIGAMIAAAIRQQGGSAVVTPSRRTGPAGIAILQKHLAGLPVTIWDGSGNNPYYAYLAAADAVLVTADSVSMISEAAATGKPVHIIGLPGGDSKFARFHQAMQAGGITCPFAGRIEHWTYAAPDDTARAGAMLRELVLTRLAQRQQP
jgi:mitochondrial fission protein ELM1